MLIRFYLLLSQCTYHICLDASPLDFCVSVAIVSATWSAIPAPAVPEPKITTRTSSNLTWLTWSPANIAASVTQPVPWISSLKHGIFDWYLSRILLAFANPKSSLVSLVMVSKEQERSIRIQVNVSLREPLASSLDESVDELIIFLASDPMLPETQIKIIIEQFFVLCTLSAR